MSDDTELVMLSRAEIHAIIDVFRHCHRHKPLVYTQWRWTIGSALIQLCRVMPYGLFKYARTIKSISDGHPGVTKHRSKLFAEVFADTEEKALEELKPDEDAEPPNPADNQGRCPGSEDGQHCGWEMPNLDMVCLECGKVL